MNVLLLSWYPQHSAYLEGVHARAQFRNIHPLTVYVVPVNVRAVNRDALIAKVRAGVKWRYSWHALIILQTE